MVLDNRLTDPCRERTRATRLLRALPFQGRLYRFPCIYPSISADNIFEQAAGFDGEADLQKLGDWGKKSVEASAQPLGGQCSNNHSHPLDYLDKHHMSAAGNGGTMITITAKGASNHLLNVLIFKSKVMAGSRAGEPHPHSSFMQLEKVLSAGQQMHAARIADMADRESAWNRKPDIHISRSGHGTMSGCGRGCGSIRNMGPDLQALTPRC